MSSNRGIGRSTNLATFSENQSGRKAAAGAAHIAIQPMYPHYVGSSSLEKPSRRHLTSFEHWRARRTPAFSVPAVNCFKILHFHARHSAPVKQSFDSSPNRTVPTQYLSNYH
jgi:hypothetical protein